MPDAVNTHHDHRKPAGANNPESARCSKKKAHSPRLAKSIHLCRWLSSELYASPGHSSSKILVLPISTGKRPPEKISSFSTGMEYYRLFT
jgi:hypothetical protein